MGPSVLSKLDLDLLGAAAGPVVAQTYNIFKKLSYKAVCNEEQEGFYCQLLESCDSVICSKKVC